MPDVRVRLRSGTDGTYWCRDVRCRIRSPHKLVTTAVSLPEMLLGIGGLNFYHVGLTAGIYTASLSLSGRGVEAGSYLADTYMIMLLKD